MVTDIPTFVQGNTKPDITAILHAEDDPTAVVDLTRCTVRFQMRTHNAKRFTVNAAANIVGDPTLGSVSYSWAANDLATPGDYECQWEITNPDLTVQTTAHPNVVTVLRQ